MACWSGASRYGAGILQDLAHLSLADPGDPGELRLGKAAPVPFAALAQKEHAWQVSRTFSALLQLANAGNVAILRARDSPAEPFALRLQSLDAAHEQFADYRAPSFLQTKVRACAVQQPGHEHASDLVCMMGSSVHAGHQCAGRRHR